MEIEKKNSFCIIQNKVQETESGLLCDRKKPEKLREFKKSVKKKRGGGTHGI